MNFFSFSISNKIETDSKEYASMTDEKKQDSFINIIKDRLSKIECSNKIFNPRPNSRTYNIPYEDLKIFHRDQAIIGFDGSIFIDGQYFKIARHKNMIEHTYNYVENLSFKKIRSIRDVKNFLKKFYFSYFSPSSYRNRKIFQNPTVVKILFFETAYDNMYHFLFQYYSSLLALLTYCQTHNIEYYVIMPPKCNRGLRYKHFYPNMIHEIIKLENIQKEKICYLDYQNYRVNNIIHTNFAIDNPNIYIPTVRKIQKYFYDCRFSYSHERIYISRRKAKKRFLINEQEIKKILEIEYGFKTVYMEECSLFEKINIMMRAKVIASVDGTSLVNGYFSTQKSVKLIAFRLHDMTEWGPIISAMFENLEYLPIIASPQSISQHEFYDNIWYETNLYVKPEYMRKKLNEYGIHPNILK